MQKPVRGYGITKVEYARKVAAFEAQQAFMAQGPGDGFFSKLVKRFR